MGDMKQGQQNPQGGQSHTQPSGNQGDMNKGQDKQGGQHPGGNQATNREPAEGGHDKNKDDQKI